jgi:hypothetical protein
MDALQLPLLKPSDTIRQAMDYMKIADARAIVVGPGESKQNKYVLQMNTAVMKGYQARQQFLYQLEDPGILVTDFSDRSLLGKIRRTLYEFGSTYEIESLMDSEGSGYALAGPAYGGVPVATVVTRHESYTAQIRSAQKVCVCDGPGAHVADSPPKHDGDECDFDTHHYICR